MVVLDQSLTKAHAYHEYNVPVAQLVEQEIENLRVGGSIPSGDTNISPKYSLDVLEE